MHLADVVQHVAGLLILLCFDPRAAPSLLAYVVARVRASASREVAPCWTVSGMEICRWNGIEGLRE